jgi:hypothetical protein
MQNVEGSMNNNKIRVAFEDWQSDGGKWKKCIEQNSAGYALMQTSLNWRAWQAGGAAYAAEIDRLNANLAQTTAAEIEYLANAEHVFSDSQDAMQCLDYLRALRDVDARRQEVPKRCPACGGNDAGMPCAYPSEGKTGCPRDVRLKAPNRTDFKTWERTTLELFARQLADEHKRLRDQLAHAIDLAHGEALLIDVHQPSINIDVVMTMVQEFASTWSLVGHRSFDNGSMLERAEALKENIRNMLEKENCNG